MFAMFAFSSLRGREFPVWKKDMAAAWSRVIVQGSVSTEGGKEYALLMDPLM